MFNKEVAENLARTISIEPLKAHISGFELILETDKNLKGQDRTEVEFLLSIYRDIFKAKVGLIFKWLTFVLVPQNEKDMLDELESKIDNVLKGRGYDIHSVVKTPHEGVQGLHCSGDKQKCV